MTTIVNQSQQFRRIIFRNEDSNVCNEQDSLLDRDWGIRIGDYEVIVTGSDDTSSDERMDALLDNSIIRSSQDARSIETSNIGKNWLTVVKIIIDALQFPFEILVLSCMIAIIRISVSQCRQLSFTLDHVGLSTKLWWLWMMISAAIAIILFKITRAWTSTPKGAWHQDEAAQRRDPANSHFA